MAKKKASNKELEKLYETFRKKVSEKAGVDIFALKIPVDRLAVKVGEKVERMHFLKAVEEKYGLTLDDLRKAGWTTGRVPKMRGCFYLFPPGVGEGRKQAKATKPELEL